MRHAPSTEESSQQLLENQYDNSERAGLGSPFVMPSDCMVVASDADAARSEPQAPFYVSSGDLHEALGKPRQPKAGGECQLLPIDAMQYAIQNSDGKELSAFAISSITIGRWYRGAFFVLSNSGFHKSRHLLPRAHQTMGSLICFHCAVRCLCDSVCSLKGSPESLHICLIQIFASSDLIHLVSPEQKHMSL